MTVVPSIAVSQDTRKSISILIFSALFMAGAYFHQPVDYDNTSSRYFLVSAVVDRGTLSIDENEKETIDKSFYNGHYYSNKAIGAPLLGVPVYWITRHLPFLKDSPPLSPSSKYIVRLFTTTLPFALLGVVMFWLACSAGASVRNSFLMVVAYSFGTISLIHSTLFSGHQIAASFLFFSFALVCCLAGRVDEPCRFSRPVVLFLSGLFAGFAAITDYPAVIIVFLLTVYVLSLRLPFRNVLIFISGGMTCAGLVAVYNILCFDNPISLSYSHLSFEKFRDEATSGLFGINLPRFGTLTALLFSPARGIFIIMPVLLLALAGLGEMIAGEKNRREAFFIIAVCIAYVFFNSGYSGWHGGWTFGPRYLVPMLPFLAFAIAFCRLNSFSFFLLFLLSAFQILPAVVGMPHAPEGVRNPLVEIIIPCIGQGYLARNAGMLFGLPGLLSVVPVALVIGYLLLITNKKTKRMSAGEDGRGRAMPRFIVYAWLIVVIGLLGFTSTTPEKMIHAYRWRLLCHAGWILKSPELMKASEIEAALAGDLLR